jgi:hypothetical protein
MHLRPLVLARQLARPRPSWTVLFAKAYAAVAARTPELRRSYLSFPRPHLYEHATSVASVAVEREYRGEPGVFFGQLREPDRKGLAELDRQLRVLREAPLESVAAFRKSLRLTRLPLPLRRLGWWVGLNVSGRKRAGLLGTFAVSAYGGLGASSLHPLSPLTTTLNFGPIEPDGGVDVRLIYDHRVLDGATVARALEELERVLLGEIVNELRYLQALEAA